MRPVDTAALAGVAPTLGVGNPATATQEVEFDDGNLQQSMDVGAHVRYSAADGFGITAGWRHWSVDQAWLTGIGYYNTSDGIDLEVNQCAWIYGVGCYVTASAALADFDSAHFGIILPPAARVGGTPKHMPLLNANVNNIIQESAVAGWARNLGNPGVPFPVPYFGGGSYLYYGGRQTAAAGTVTVNWSMIYRILPIGTPPMPL